MPEVRQDESHTAPAARLTRAMGVIETRNLSSAPNVSHGEIGVLGYLVSHGGAAAPSDLAEALNVTASRIANTLKALQKKGYIVRDINPQDRRGVIVSITDAGKAYGEANYQETVANTAHLLSALSAEEQAELARLAEKIASSLEES
ncbi:MAG: MarR family winged helix-turn-helix transcriptional regulator [Atopobiaceae bacterium]